MHLPALSPRIGRILSVVAILSGLAAIIWGWRPLHQPLDLLRWTPGIYDDRDDPRGNSRSWMVPGEGFRFAWALHPGAPWPYAGAFLSPHSGLADLSGYDQLVVRWRSRRAYPLQLLFHRDEPGTTIPGHYDTRRVFRDQEHIEVEWSKRTIKLSAFSTPPWWFTHLGRIADTLQPRFDRITDFVVSAGETTPLDAPDTVEIRTLTLQAPPAHPALGTVFAILLIALGSWGGVASRQRPAGDIPDGTPAPPEPGWREIFWDYMRSHYRETGLDLPRAARETGLGEYRIGEMLRSERLTFRAVLNDMRVREATRLLESTDFQVSEIAARSGFGSVAHFNRVFKAKRGMSPSEARQASHSATPN